MEKHFQQPPLLIILIEQLEWFVQLKLMVLNLILLVVVLHLNQKVKVAEAEVLKRLKKRNPPIIKTVIIPQISSQKIYLISLTNWVMQKTEPLALKKLKQWLARWQNLMNRLLNIMISLLKLKTILRKTVPKQKILLQKLECLFNMALMEKFLIGMN